MSAAASAVARRPVRTGLSCGQPAWPDTAARLYAEALDVSDYAPAAATRLRQHLGSPASLLDIGAGGGHIGTHWLQPDAAWTALEPNRYLRARLGRLARSGWPMLHVADGTWEAMGRSGISRHAVVLGANMAGPLYDAARFLQTCRDHAAHALAWIVPAQQPRRLCLSAALPASLHGEPASPTGLALALDALDPSDRPQTVEPFDWTYRSRFPSLGAATSHLAAALGWAADDRRRTALHQHLGGIARPLDGGVEIAAPKRSALLVWKLT